MAAEKPAKKQISKALPDAFSLFMPSWRAFRLNIDAFVMQFLFPVGLLLLTVLLAGVATDADSAAVNILVLCAAIVTGVVCVIVAASLTVTQLKSAADTKLSFEQAVRQGLGYFWRLLGLFILSAILICVGFLLLIVPGLFALQRLLLAPYFLVDKNIGVIEAMRRSNAAAKKYSGAVWGVVGILIAINLLGLIPVVGWIVGTALSIMYLCAPALRYMQIARATKT